MITTFKFCARAIFSLLEKTHPPPRFTKFEFKKFFSLFYIISTQRSYIYKKPDTNRCFAKLRAISNLFSFFIHPVYCGEFYSLTKLVQSCAKYMVWPNTAEKRLRMRQHYWNLYCERDVKNVKRSEGCQKLKNASDKERLRCFCLFYENVLYGYFTRWTCVLVYWTLLNEF